MTDPAIRAALEARIHAAWRTLLSAAEADRIGATTLMVMAHEASKAAAVEEAARDA